MQSSPNDTPQLGSKKNIVLIILAVIGGGGFIVCLGCAGLAAWFMKMPAASESAKQPFDVASVPLPPLPDRGAGSLVEPGIMRYEMWLGADDGTPGHGQLVWLYLPEDVPADAKLPCVVIAPAGSNMVSGMGLAEGDMPEHLPYVREGFAVVSFEVDGYTDPTASVEDDDNEMLRTYKAFRAACAGVVNARNAVDYVIAKVPEVDPNQIYAAGHSSAATLALLLTAHDDRIAACAAYAPVHDVVGDMGGPGVRILSSILPKLVDFLTQSSPITHYSDVNVPVFLFHAEDDVNVDVAQTREATATLESMGKHVTTVIVPTGNHYDSMIQEGIPRGIEWLKQQRR